MSMYAWHIQASEQFIIIYYTYTYVYVDEIFVLIAFKDRMWRKTRSRVNGHKRGCVGVDANRNFDFQWLCKYRSRYDKPPLAARCCHLANDLTNFTGVRRTNEQTNIWTSPSRKATICDRRLNNLRKKVIMIILCVPENETPVISNILYSCKSIAMKFSM